MVGSRECDVGSRAAEASFTGGDREMPSQSRDRESEIENKGGRIVFEALFSSLLI